MAKKSRGLCDVVYRLMPQWLRNWWGGRWHGNHRYCRCDNCGRTFWHNLSDRYVVYTKEPLPKAKHYRGSTYWEFCRNCPPRDYIVDRLILRIYHSQGGPADLTCVDCGRFHPANVCFATHSEDEVQAMGTGFPIELGPGKALNTGDNRTFRS